MPTNCLSGSNQPHCPIDKTHGALSAKKSHHRSGDVYHRCGTNGCGYNIWVAPQNQDAAKESGKRKTAPSPVNIHVHVQAAQTPDPMQTLHLLHGLKDFIDSQQYKRPCAEGREPWWEKLHTSLSHHEQGKGGHCHGPPPPPFSLSRAKPPPAYGAQPPPAYGAQPPPAYGALPLSQRDGSATGLPRSAPISFRAPGPIQPQPPLPAVEPPSAPEAKKKKIVSFEEVERLSSQHRSTQGTCKKRPKKVRECSKGSTKMDAMETYSSSDDEMMTVE